MVVEETTDSHSKINDEKDEEMQERALESKNKTKHQSGLSERKVKMWNLFDSPGVSCSTLDHLCHYSPQSRRAAHGAGSVAVGGRRLGLWGRPCPRPAKIPVGLHYTKLGTAAIAPHVICRLKASGDFSWARLLLCR